MKIIHDPPNCPLCEYSRQELEPGRPCPECGLGLFPGTPVFDLSPRFLCLGGFLTGGLMFVLAALYAFVPLPDRRIVVPFYLGAAGVHVWMGWWVLTVRVRVVLSLEEIVFVRSGRIRWRLPYDDLVAWRGRWLLGGVFLREAGGKRRSFAVWRRKDQRVVIAAIDDVLGRYRSHRDAEEPLPDGRGSDGA